MKAAVYRRYGSPEVLEIRDIARPAVPDDGVLVRVRAAALNRMDWYFLTGKPYLTRMLTGPLKPKHEVPGADFAGTVESVGSGVTRVRPGDDVFGAARGALAEYICVTEDRVGPKPGNLTFEQAAAVPVAGLTALQGFRDHGRIQTGQQVLINGASGGVGTFAVQIARSFGAEVTAVCSTRNVDQARSIGAGRVIDYTREDFTLGERRYDLMFDVAGNRTLSECARVLRPTAAYVIAGGPMGNRWIGPLGRLLKLGLASKTGRRKVVFFIARVNTEDLTALRDLLEAGKVTPVIDGRYELSGIREAFRHLGEGHPRGKIVIAL